MSKTTLEAENLAETQISPVLKLNSKHKASEHTMPCYPSIPFLSKGRPISIRKPKATQEILYCMVIIKPNREGNLVKEFEK